MLNRQKFLWIILVNCVFYSHTHSQTITYNVFELSFLYDEARFEQILKQTAELLQHNHALDKNQLIEIHKYRALAFYNTGQPDSSRINFFSLLSLENNYTLDPVKISPKIIAFFNEIKTNYKDEISRQKALPFSKYIFVEDIRPYAALRSFFLPGWGQHYKNQTTKGYILNGSFAMTAAATIISYTFERKLREDYLTASNELKIKSLYNDYNSMSKTRRIFQYTTILIWIYSVTDALYSDYTPILERNENYIGISLNISF